MRKSWKKKEERAKREARQQWHRDLLNFSCHVRKNVTRIANIFKGWVEFNEIAPRTFKVSRTVSEINRSRSSLWKRLQNYYKFFFLYTSIFEIINLLNYTNVWVLPLCYFEKCEKDKFLITLTGFMHVRWYRFIFNKF